MNYKKPKINFELSIVDTVHHSSQDKGQGILLETVAQDYLDTMNAYEADE